MTKNHLIFVAAFVGLVGCAPSQSPDPNFEPVQNNEQHIPSNAGDEPAPADGRRLVLHGDLYVRTLKNGVLEKVETLPEDSVIIVPFDGTTVNPPYRDEQGNSAFSSTGFLPIVRIASVPEDETDHFPPERLKALVALPGGLYISAAAGQDTDSAESTFPKVNPGTAGTEYLSFYDAGGKPKFNYTKSLVKKFGDHLNKAVPMSSLPGADQTKWTRIMAELEKVGDRTQASPRHWLMIDLAEGRRLANEFEKNKKVPLEGAWTVAVQGTAVNHGFQNVPCAEFQGEILREAYARAGYSHFDDFNDKKKNRLDYQNGASAVVNFAKYLDLAGWIPWDGSIYAPPAGAFIMNASGNTPGHAYMSGGDRGRIIVDNGMPQGRDLRITSKKIIDMMYQNGVFFLPPGFIPQKW